MDLAPYLALVSVVPSVVTMSRRVRRRRIRCARALSGRYTCRIPRMRRMTR